MQPERLALPGAGRWHRRAALSLDVAGVLVLPEPTRVLSDCHDGEQWDAVHYLVRVRETDVRPSTSWDAVAGVVGVSRSRLDEYVSAYQAVHTDPAVWTRVVPDAPRLLAECARTGVPVAAVSNTVRPMTRDILRAAGLAGSGGIRDERTFDSSVLGLAKPDPRLYEQVFAALGRPAADVVHVGDSLDEDVRGAQGAGADAVHLTPFDGCADPTHRHVRGLGELVPTPTDDSGVTS